MSSLVRPAPVPVPDNAIVTPDMAPRIWQEFKESYVYYHGTSSNSIASILIDGLVPANKPFTKGDADFLIAMLKKSSDAYDRSEFAQSLLDKNLRNVSITTDQSVAIAAAEDGAEYLSTMQGQIRYCIESGKLDGSEVEHLSQIRKRIVDYKQTHQPVVLEIKGSALENASSNLQGEALVQYLIEEMTQNGTVPKTKQEIIQRISKPHGISEVEVRRVQPNEFRIVGKPQPDTQMN